MAHIALRQVTIDNAARERAREIMRYAFEHRETLVALRNRLASGRPLPEAENFSMKVPVGYSIAYTIEQRDRGWVQHVSVYQETPRMHPHPPAVAAIITELFGITCAHKNMRGAGVLAEALEVSEQKLPNGCIAVDLLYPFKFPA